MSAIGILCLRVSVCVYVYVCVLCVVHAYKNTVACMCGWCLLVKTACTYLPCGHVIGAVCSGMWCLCVCVCECMQVCAAHPENTPDASHCTNSSCRDWLWLRLDRKGLRKLKLMSESSNHSSTFFRCCAVAKLEDTLDHSSVVGYRCKAIQ